MKDIYVNEKFTLLFKTTDPDLSKRLQKSLKGYGINYKVYPIRSGTSGSLTMCDSFIFEDIDFIKAAMIQKRIEAIRNSWKGLVVSTKGRILPI